MIQAWSLRQHVSAKLVEKLQRYLLELQPKCCRGPCWTTDQPLTMGVTDAWEKL
jgi:hypothetical protein